jgi:hypothetical protein
VSRKLNKTLQTARPLHTFMAYCDEHGKFYYHGAANCYCPARVWRWGRWMTCLHRGRANPDRHQQASMVANYEALEGEERS